MKMDFLIYLVMSLFALLAGASGQCFSPNDNVAVPTAAEFNSVSRFGLDLHKQLFPFNDTGNYIISPYALWKSLTLAYFGSSGNTQAELEEVLGTKDKISSLKVWSYLDRLYKTERNNTPEMRMSARAFIGKKRDLRPCVETILNDSLVVQDFSNVYRSAIEINNWVYSSTGGMIKTLYQPNELLDTNMVLASAGAHKGNWLNPFKSSSTRTQPFYTSLDNYEDVITMTQKGHFNYGESAELGVQILEMPYAGRSVSMFILLPPLNSGSVGIINTMKSLNPSTLRRAMSEMQHAEVRVVLPKFKIQYEASVDLREAISRMGAKDLFNKLETDLTIFSPDGKLSVGQMTHRAYVDVDEGGVDTASAKTFKNVFRGMGPLKHRVFVCNRPFLFLLMDNMASRILFIGAYRDPNE